MADLVHTAKLAVMRVLEAAPDSVGSVSSVRTARPHIVMTFDDGPTAGRTPDVMRALADHGATATFFVLRTSLRAHRGLLADLVAAGHEIGLHGVDHRHLSALDPHEVYANVRSGAAEIEDAIGAPVRWFRPPYGDQTVGAWRAIRRAGLTSVIWSGTSWDWNPDVDNDIRIAKATANLAPGTILLFHDGHAGEAELAFDGPEPVLDRYDLVHRFLAECDVRGLRGVSLGDALEAGGTLVTRPHFNLRPRFLRSA